MAGGNGSFQFVCQHADLFAGAAPQSGGPHFRYERLLTGEKQVAAQGLENLLATPIYWVVGGKDKKLPREWVQAARTKLTGLGGEFIFKEYPDGGHEWFPAENEPVLAWMDRRRRDPYPRRVAISTNERRFNRNFWLEISGFKGREIIKRVFQDSRKLAIEERLIFQDRITARAEIVAGKNEIHVKTTGATSVRIYLHEKMVDFTKPIRIKVNKTTKTVRPNPSVRTLLDSARRDRGLLYMAVVGVSAR